MQTVTSNSITQTNNVFEGSIGKEIPKLIIFLGVGLAFSRIQQRIREIKWTIIRSNKSLVSELGNFMAQIFNIL